MSGRDGRRERGRRDERGQMAGIEAVLFGFLVILVGTLLIANAWAVVDAKMAVASAAREAARAYVEARAGSDPAEAAQAAGRDAIAGYGRDPGRLQLVLESGSFVRCARVTFRATYTVPAVVLPWVGGSRGGYEVSARHSEVVDPYRSGLPTGGTGCGS